MSSCKSRPQVSLKPLGYSHLFGPGKERVVGRTKLHNPAAVLASLDMIEWDLMVSLCTNGQPNIYTCKGVLKALNELTVVTDRPTKERTKQSVEVAIRQKIIFSYIFLSKKKRI